MRCLPSSFGAEKVAPRGAKHISRTRLMLNSETYYQPRRIRLRWISLTSPAGASRISRRADYCVRTRPSTTCFAAGPFFAQASSVSSTPTRQNNQPLKVDLLRQCPGWLPCSPVSTHPESDRHRNTTGGSMSETKLAQIAERIYRISTCIPEIAPGGFTFNQFLIDADEPLLYHTGMHSLFPAVRDAVERVLPVERLRWIGFAHMEADECGAVNDFLQVAPHAQVAHGVLGCSVSL